MTNRNPVKKSSLLSSKKIFVDCNEDFFVLQLMWNVFVRTLVLFLKSSPSVKFSSAYMRMPFDWLCVSLLHLWCWINQGHGNKQAEVYSFSNLALGGKKGKIKRAKFFSAPCTKTLLLPQKKYFSDYLLHYIHFIFYMFT